MKRALSLSLILLAAALILVGCGSRPDTSADDGPGAAAVSESPAKEAGSTTLMVYMIGSDLESKSGAGSEDLEEMLTSGVDLSRTKVLICTGGTKQWHTESTDAESIHFLHMTESGFEKVYSRQPASMGDHDTFAEFLNYCYENYRSDEYALVLWDHGNGPLIGYGKDTLYRNDSLTLPEMRAALEATPFSGESKLSWVGFDACLMSSAELACIWADHADYLIASQETEPVFGWNYAFLSDLGKTGTMEFAETVTSGYLETCEAYYDERGFDGRDTTLACLDLSHAEELRTALEALFSAASKDLGEKYDAFAEKRANTRALGRTSTGSEYDIVDLLSLVRSMSEFYPEESAAVERAIGDTVVVNSCNAEQLCGLSLYYPFFNKYYYTAQWEEMYGEIGVFPEYYGYIRGFAGQWLLFDEVGSYAESVMPQTVGKQEFIYELTEAEAAHFAGACFYILERTGEERYRQKFISGQIEREGNTLRANFDGYALYITSGQDRSIAVIPPYTENERIGGVSKCTAIVACQRYVSPYGKTDDEEETGYINRVLRYNLAVDRKNRTVSVSSIVPVDSELTDGGLSTGKTEEPDLSEWENIAVYPLAERFFQRNANGVIPGVDEWQEVWRSYMWKVFSISEGISFIFEPLDEGEYFIVFEIRDTYGNTYCSELLPIEVENTRKPVREPEKSDRSEFEWEEEDRLEIYHGNGLKADLLISKYNDTVCYYVEVCNTGDRYLKVELKDFVFNGEYSVEYSLISLDCPPGLYVSKPIDLSHRLSTYDGTGLLEGPIRSMSFQLNLWQEPEAPDERSKKLDGREITVVPRGGKQLRLYTEGSRLSAAFPDITEPCKGFYAGEQVILEENGVKVTLRRIGTESDSSGRGGYLTELYVAVLVENHSENTIDFELNDLCINGVLTYFSKFTRVSPGQSQVDLYSAWIREDPDPDDYLSLVGSIETLELYGSIQNTYDSNYDAVRYFRYAVEPEQHGTADPEDFREGEQILYRDNGIRISLVGYEADDYDQRWWISLVNESDLDVTVRNLLESGLDGYVFPNFLPAGQKRVAYISYDDEYSGPMEVRFQFLDQTEGKIWFTADSAITLSVP